MESKETNPLNKTPPPVSEEQMNTYYLVAEDWEKGWKLFEYSGRPHGKDQIDLSERAGLELGCKIRVPSVQIALTKEAAYENALVLQNAVVAAAGARLDSEEATLAELKEFKP